MLTSAATFGLGQEQADTIAHQSQALLYTNIASSVIVFAFITVKLSIATFLLRLVSSSLIQRITIIIPAAILVVIQLTGLVVVWFSCRPIAYSWDYSIQVGVCNTRLQYIMVLIAGLSLPLVEFFYASFAWYLIHGLQMPRTEKIVIGSCMSIGYLWVLLSLVIHLGLLSDTVMNMKFCFL